MQVELKVPEVGESITEGFLSCWLVPDGSLVRPDTEVFELETDKVTMPVPAGDSGRLQVLVPEGSDVSVGQVVARIDTAAESAAPFREPPPSPTTPPPAPEIAPVAPGSTTALEPPAGPARAATRLRADQASVLSPAVRRLVQQHGLDPAGIAGTGRDGRLTKGDVLLAVQAAEPAVAPTPEPAPEPAPQEEPAPEAPVVELASGEPRQTRSRLPRMRARIAERLLQAQAEAAMLTTINEVDMGALMALRARHKQDFKDAHGVNLGFMSFFVKAVVGALVA